MAILGENATAAEKAAWVVEQAEDPAVRRALYRRVVRRLDTAERAARKAEQAVAEARSELAALALAFEAAYGDQLAPRRR